ncbi:MAG TPA: sigma 54-interacting transcriptional regulator, partial [Spongiibacteraceae bacterium]|nr:sigma 54-interacting transcriptional regulator [Spongiibacteraceae bacterium]
NKKGKLQQADGGTLFLDEIGDMPLDLQVKLLRVLQDRQVNPVGGDSPIDVDFRIITATHINLKQAVESGRFRLDLFFRLNVVPVSLPPLRERNTDIPALTSYFLERYQGMYRRQLSLTTGVMERLQSYSWPGNIRQLQNVLERTVLQTEGSLITTEQIDRMLADEAHMPFQQSLQPAAQTLTVVPQTLVPQTVAPQTLVPQTIAPQTASQILPQETSQISADSSPSQAAPPTISSIDRQSIRFDRRSSDRATHTGEPQYRPYLRVDSNDRDRIIEILSSTGGNQTRAAELLGLTVRQLRYRLRKLV